MPRPVPPPRNLINAVQVDPVWLEEWVEYGFREMAVYLSRHAAFEAYLTRHQRKDQE